MRGPGREWFQGGFWLLSLSFPTRRLGLRHPPGQDVLNNGGLEVPCEL